MRVSDGGSNAPATSEAEVDFEELRLYLDSVDDREPVHFVIHLEGAPALDFRELAKAHASLSELASPGTCMGTVYPGANLLTLLTKSCSQVSPVFER